MKLIKQQVVEASDRQLDIWIAKYIVGYKFEGYKCQNMAALRKVLIPPYSSDLNLCYQAEEKIKEMGQEKQYNYYRELGIIINQQARKSQDRYDFSLIHAPPKQRCQAMLLTVCELEDKNV